MPYLLFLAILLLNPSAYANEYAYQIEEDTQAVRILAYYGVGQDDSPATSVTLSQFKAHLKELHQGGYNVVALPDVLNAYEKNAPVPVNSVMITFDGSEKSLVTQAAPLLKKYKFPFTVFLSPERVSQNNPRYLTLKDIKKLHKLQLVSFGIHPENYEGESFDDVQTYRSQINNAVSFYRDLFGEQPQYFAFPNGLYSKTQMDVIKKYGFKAVMGQQSGVVYNNPKNSVMPRFVMTENYADARRFEMATGALPLPVSDMTPNTSIIGTENPMLGFTVSNDLSLDKLACYAAGQPKPTLERLSQRIEMRLKAPITDPRFRINCTLPVINEDTNKPDQWRWFGLLLQTN